MYKTALVSVAILSNALISLEPNRSKKDTHAVPSVTIKAKHVNNQNR